VEQVTSTGDRTDAHTADMHRRPEEKKLLVRCRCRWKSNIKTDLKVTGWEGVEWIHLAQNTSK
jgi:hypothetical protein